MIKDEKSVHLEQLLTLKAPNKNLQQRTLIFLLLSFKESKASCFMCILCLAEASHEISSLIFSEKKNNEKVFMNGVSYSRDWGFKG